jgi:hypothetical protein
VALNSRATTQSSHHDWPQALGNNLSTVAKCQQLSDDERLCHSSHLASGEACEYVKGQCRSALWWTKIRDEQAQVARRFSARLRLATAGGEPLPHDTFAGACLRQNQLPPHLLMVPKTGSRSLTEMQLCPRYVVARKERRVHLHATTYLPCSLVSLREPCDRFRSIFRHLFELYHRRTDPQYCNYISQSPSCPTHWFHRAK